MFKRFLIFLFICIACTSVYARDTTGPDTSALHIGYKNMRISFLVCGVGNDTWQSFGHCAVRIIDDSRDSAHKDLVYNYGMFSGFEGSLQNQFLKGNVRVFLDVPSFRSFIDEYRSEGRAVWERALLLDDGQKEKVQAFLENNALIENRYYTYNIFYDNCTIGVRDMLEKTLGQGFVFGNVLPPNTNMTFHDVYLTYLGRKYWFRLFGNIFYGSKTDIRMSNRDAMFLPDYLEKGLQNATYNGKRIGGERVVILESKVPPLPAINWPVIIFWLIALLTIAGLSIPRLRFLGKIMGFFVLTFTTLIGVGILYAWFFAYYDLCRDNYNILWAIPFNIILPFLPRAIRAVYSIVAFFLICVCLVVHLAGIQLLPLAELIPLWIALSFIYGNSYRNSKRLH